MFTHTLLVRCSNSDYLDKLLETLIHTMQSSQDRRREQGVLVARRFLRSVMRVFVVLTAQSTPEKLAAKSSFHSQPTTKCRRAFVVRIDLPPQSEWPRAGVCVVVRWRRNILRGLLAVALPVDFAFTRDRYL